MYEGEIVFSQVMQFLPMHAFRRCVQRYKGNHKVIRFTCLDQYLCMAFGQLKLQAAKELTALPRADTRM